MSLRLSTSPQQTTFLQHYLHVNIWLFVPGDLTQRGFELLKAAMWVQYEERLQTEGKQPVRAPPKVLYNADGHPHDTEPTRQEQVGQKVDPEHADNPAQQRKTADSTEEQLPQR